MTTNHQENNPPEITQVTRDEESVKSQVDKSQVDQPQDHFPPVRRRSPGQIEWSRQLGKRSQEFKRAKKDRSTTNKIPEMSPPQNDVVTPQNEDTTQNEDTAQNEDTTENSSSSSLLFPALIAGGILCGLWCYQKYPKPDNHHKPDNRVKPDLSPNTKIKERSTVKDKITGVLSME